MVTKFVDELAHEYQELRLVAGVFNHIDVEATDDLQLDITHALEFARYAASDFAVTHGNKVIHFGMATAHRILNEQRESKAYAQGIADFEKLRGLGIFNATFLNQGGLALE